MTAPKSILLDNDFLSDIRVRSIFRKYGEVGIARYIHLITRLNDERGEMLMRHVLLLGDMINVPEEKWQEFISFCMEEKITEQEGERVYVKRLIADAKNVETKRKAWRDRQKKKRDVTRDTSVTSQGTSEEETETEEETELDNKKNGEPPEKHPAARLTKYHDHVWVSETQIEPLMMRFNHEGVGEEGLARAMELLDRDLEKNSEKRGFRCMFKDLIAWPLTQVKLDNNRIRRSSGAGPPKKSAVQIYEEMKLRGEL